MNILRTPADRARLIEKLMEMPLPVEVEAKPYKRKRSLSLNAYYFGFVATPIAEHMGQSVEETHRDLCGDYFGWAEKEFNGYVNRKPRRTTTENENGKRDVLNWEQFSNFVEHAKMVGANMGVRFPEYDSRMAG